jgi:cell division protein FtsI/penicillin-binding protein 2
VVNLRRCGPLIGGIGLAAAVLVARLYEVQVRQHETWAREAVNLARSWEVMPYQRGAILDREGRRLAQDERVYELEFVWREFRRGHGLGQVAQLRSVLGMHYVPLDVARADLIPWARAFLALSPAQIDGFGEGGFLRVGNLEVPAISVQGRRARLEAVRHERRGTRASELHFYTKALLGLGSSASRDLERLRKESPDRSYLALAARVMGIEPDGQAEQVSERLTSALAEMDTLAQRVNWSLLVSEAGDVARPWDTGPLADRLLALVEFKRSEVQFATADALFKRAAGFDPARLDADNLACVDLDWLRRALYWDESRLDQWRVDRGRLWPERVYEHLAGYTIVRSKLAPHLAPPGQRVMSSLAMAFNADTRRTLEDSACPRPWWEVERVVGLTHLMERSADPDQFDPECGQGVLPCQDEILRTLTDGQRLEATLPPGGLALADPPKVRAQRMLDVASSPSPTWDPVDEPCFVSALLHWDGLLQERVADVLERLDGPLKLDAEWVEAALERRAYFVRDWGARPVLLDSQPGYDLVYAVTRDPGTHAGFRVRATTRRVRLEVDDSSNGKAVAVAAPLLGRVRSPYLLNLLEQQPRESDLRDLRRKRQLQDQDLSEIQDLVGSTLQAGEVMGGSGLEGYFDLALKGRSGFHVSSGLQDRVEGTVQSSFQPAVDGEDLGLTLDLDLQRAAQAVIDAPEPPPDGEQRPDRLWHEHPVGAIVLVSTHGDVLAAASGPSVLGRIPGQNQDGQARFAYDRTLRQHTFQPPGSVFKPFVAAWALDRGWIDAEQTHVQCEPRQDEVGGMHREGAKVHCHSIWGHGDLTLNEALLHSCNAYFAMVGEEHYSATGFRDMARTFGFDRPTGVRSLDHGVRHVWGLREDARSNGFFRDDRPATKPTLQRLGNGLTAISTTVLQIARAYVGLATGRLPELRLVQSVGGVPMPRHEATLPLSSTSLEIVRRSLRRVTVDGTAKGTGLDSESLGFHLACKTGSADYQPGQVPDGAGGWEAGMRKHGWVAGWFPAEKPKAIVVVYVHDTSTTSSHVATHVMRQFLSSSAVRQFVEQGR